MFVELRRAAAAIAILNACMGRLLDPLLALMWGPANAPSIGIVS
jgi:hypothetical protein